MDSMQAKLSNMTVVSAFHSCLMKNCSHNITAPDKSVALFDLFLFILL